MTQISGRWMAVMWAVSSAMALPACGGDPVGATGGSSSSSSASGTTGTGGHGGSGSSSSSTGTGGMGGADAGAPFTSHGAASYEAQTSVAADAKGGVVACWIGFFANNTSAIGYAVSRDGGGSFTAPAYVSSPGGRLSSNPVVAVDGQGRFFLTWLGFRPDVNMPDEHVYVSRLDGKTETFAPPVIASDDGVSTTRDFDKPSLTIDANDNLLLTWADFTGSNMNVPAQLTLARSPDGASFTRSTITADATFGNLASLCLDTAVGPTAPLYLVHLGGGQTVTLRRSLDQGKSWQILPVPAKKVLFQDVRCVVHGKDLWVSYASGDAMFIPGQNAPADAVNVVHSGDGGDTFDAPVIASKGGAGAQYLFPALVRAPSGKLEVVYYQGTLGGSASFILSSSGDGSTWTTSKLVVPGMFTVDRFLASWLGDYVGLAATGSATFATYTDNAAGKAHIGFAKVAAP